MGKALSGELSCTCDRSCRVATVREKYQENEIFSSQGKVREFCWWSGKFRKNLESQGKVRDLENKWLWQADFRKFICSFQEGQRCIFSWYSLFPSPSSLGATLKERICSHVEQILSFKSNPQIWSDTVSTIKLKNKNDFVWDLSEGMENCKMSGKNQGKVREFGGGW